jgi:hypothetical protein
MKNTGIITLCHAKRCTATFILMIHHLESAKRSSQSVHNYLPGEEETASWESATDWMEGMEYFLKIGYNNRYMDNDNLVYE